MLYFYTTLKRIILYNKQTKKKLHCSVPNLTAYPAMYGPMAHHYGNDVTALTPGSNEGSAHGKHKQYPSPTVSFFCVSTMYFIRISYYFSSIYSYTSNTFVNNRCLMWRFLLFR